MLTDESHQSVFAWSFKFKFNPGVFHDIGNGPQRLFLSNEIYFNFGKSATLNSKSVAGCPFVILFIINVSIEEGKTSLSFG